MHVQRLSSIQDSLEILSNMSKRKSVSSLATLMHLDCSIKKDVVLTEQFI